MDHPTSEDSQRPNTPALTFQHVLILLALFLTMCSAFYIGINLAEKFSRGNRFHSNQEALQYASSTRFSGVLAMETVVDGQRDILLATINSGYGSVTPFIHTPANETSPAWAPDGRWLAYLSDASGKREVYLKRYVAWGENIQLTHQPEIEWSGPLVWQVYGRFDDEGIWTLDAWVLAVGTAKVASPVGGAAEQAAVYRIPVGGESRLPEMLTATAGISGTYRVEYGSSIAFELPGGQLAAAGLDSPAAVVVNQAVSSRGLALVPGGFAWLVPLEGSFAYLAQGSGPRGEVGLEIRKGGLRLADEDLRRSEFTEPEHPVHLSGQVDTVRAILASFGNTLYVLQDGLLDGAGADGCLRIHRYNMILVPVPASHPPLFEDVCADLPAQGFNPTNLLPVPNDRHTYNAEWIIFSGRAPGEKESGLYAAFVFAQQALSGYPKLVKLPLRLPSPVVPGSISVRTGYPIYEGGYWPVDKIEP